MRLPARLAALRVRNFRLLFTGQTFSQLGDQMAPVAISFAVLDRGGTAQQVGWVLGAGTATMVLLLLFGGVVADRLPRRSVMLGADVLRGVAQAAVAGLLVAGVWRVWELVALEAVWGIGAAFFSPALTGLLPQLLAGDALVQGNALQGLSYSLGQVVGPGLAGVLVATAGPGPAVAVDAGTFAVSALSLLRLQLPPMARVRTDRLLGELRHGWREFRSRTWLWVVVTEFGLWHLLVFAPVIVLGAVVAKTSLGGAAAWGTILSGFGAGSLAGGVVALHYRPRRPLLAATLASVCFAPVPAMLAADAPVPALTAVSALAGAGFAVFGTLWDTTMQQQIPGDVLSRVSAYDWFGSVALLPLGYLLAGPIAAVVGVRRTLWAAAAVMVVEVLAVLAVPSVRNLRAVAPANVDVPAAGGGGSPP